MKIYKLRYVDAGVWVGPKLVQMETIVAAIQAYSVDSSSQFVVEYVGDLDDLDGQAPEPQQ